MTQTAKLSQKEQAKQIPVLEIARISERGQVIIPKQVRDAIGIEKDSYLAFKVEGDTIIVKKMDLLETFRNLRASTVKVPDDVIVDEVHEIRRQLRKNSDRH